MQYIFYADVYLVQNFMIKVAVLYLSFYCNKMGSRFDTVKGVGRICFVSFLGTIVEIVALMSFDSYYLFLVFTHVVEIPLMFILITRKERMPLYKVILMGYFFTMLINSVLEALWNLFGENGSFIFCLLFSCGAVIVGGRIWFNYKKMQKGIFSAELVHDGITEPIKGFYDSGNKLKDVYTKKGVHIVSKEVLERMKMSNPVLIPYQSLGNETGMLEVYYIEELIIEGESQKIHIHNCPLGVTKDNLFEGKNYQIILNEEVF